MKLYSMRLNAGTGPLWYKTKQFRGIKKLNEFLESNKDFGFLKELETYGGDPVYIVAKNDDRGEKILDLNFDYEDTGFCQRYYRADCGRLFVVVDDQLHTCNDDAWREPCTPVDESLFRLIEF